MTHETDSRLSQSTPNDSCFSMPIKVQDYLSLGLLVVVEVLLILFVVTILYKPRFVGMVPAITSLLQT